jgi:hypothetical protein
MRSTRITAVEIPETLYATTTDGEVHPQTFEDLVASSGLVFENAGEHELKSVPGRWHLYRVAAA